MTRHSAYRTPAPPPPPRRVCAACGVSTNCQLGRLIQPHWIRCAPCAGSGEWIDGGLTAHACLSCMGCGWRPPWYEHHPTLARWARALGARVPEPPPPPAGTTGGWGEAPVRAVEGEAWRTTPFRRLVAALLSLAGWLPKR